MKCLSKVPTLTFKECKKLFSILKKEKGMLAFASIPFFKTPMIIF
jgi:hypothetical protein